MPLKAFVASLLTPLICPNGHLLPAGAKGEQAARVFIPLRTFQRERDVAVIPLLPGGEKMPAGR
ncbi:hypothetical protein CO670_23990 [Rhizobium sp. J15]|nr:hypothetical protein CO670_23990 [Rhizobium sp. J15]